MSNKIFISHRSTDKGIADILRDFFTSFGIDREMVFCSSLPGNDVNQKIKTEVKDALKNSILNIAILSKDYYESAYCLNEAGILWFNETQVIVIALPEIKPQDMIGFLDSEYKIRSLNNDEDIAYLCDEVCESAKINPPKSSIVMTETHKLKERYQQYFDGRTFSTKNTDNSTAEKIVNKKSSDHFHEKMQILKSVEKMELPTCTVGIIPEKQEPNNDKISEAELSVLFSDDSNILYQYKKLVGYINDMNQLISALMRFYHLSCAPDGYGGLGNKTWSKIFRYEQLFNSLKYSDKDEEEFKAFCNNNVFSEYIPKLDKTLEYNYLTIKNEAHNVILSFNSTKKELISLMLKNIG